MTQHSKRSQPARENQPAELHEDSTNIHKPKGAVAGIPAACQILSDREFEVLKFLADGDSPKEIAATLGINLKTVYTYRDRLRKKLRLHTDQELIRFAIKMGLG